MHNISVSVTPALTRVYCHKNEPDCERHREYDGYPLELVHEPLTYYGLHVVVLIRVPEYAQELFFLLQNILLEPANSFFKCTIHCSPLHLDYLVAGIKTDLL